MTTASSSRRWVAPIVVLLVIVLIVWYWRHKHAAAPKAPPPSPIAVTLVSVQQHDVPDYLAGVGTVTPNATVTVKARVDGQLEQVAFTEGQDVKQGQLLVKIDPRTLQAALAQAKAQKVKDSATLENQKRDLQRYVTLIAQDATTRQTLDTQRALVAQQEALLQTDDAAIESAQVQLGFTTITAPLSGRVGARLVDPGNIVHAADTTGLVIINQIDPITIVFTLPGEALSAVFDAQRHGLPMVVDAYSRDNMATPLASGKLVLVNNQIDTTSGTVQLKARFDNRIQKLWPGQYVNVRLILGQLKQALTIPAAAVQRNTQGTFVFVVQPDQTTQQQVVKVRQFQDGMAVISEGLQATQQVVLDGQSKLKNGVKIKALPPKTPATANGVADSASTSASASTAASSSASAASAASDKE